MILLSDALVCGEWGRMHAACTVIPPATSAPSRQPTENMDTINPYRFNVMDKIISEKIMYVA